METKKNLSNQHIMEIMPNACLMVKYTVRSFVSLNWICVRSAWALRRNSLLFVYIHAFGINSHLMCVWSSDWSKQWEGKIKFTWIVVMFQCATVDWCTVCTQNQSAWRFQPQSSIKFEVGIVFFLSVSLSVSTIHSIRWIYIRTKFY